MVVVLGIYATLGVTKTLAALLRDRDLIAVAFGLGMVLVGVAVVALALKVRPGGVEIGVGLGVVAVYLMVFFRIAVPEERTHLIEYSVVAALIYSALTECAANGRDVPFSPLLAIVFTGIIGTIDELIQLFLPGRVFDPVDILFNVLAAVMAVSAMVALRWARRWRGRVTKR